MNTKRDKGISALLARSKSRFESVQLGLRLNTQVIEADIAEAEDILKASFIEMDSLDYNEGSERYKKAEKQWNEAYKVQELLGAELKAYDGGLSHIQLAHQQGLLLWQSCN